jgi:hypothetical protein
MHSGGGHGHTRIHHQLGQTTWNTKIPLSKAAAATLTTTIAVKLFHLLSNIPVPVSAAKGC